MRSRRLRRQAWFGCILASLLGIAAAGAQSIAQAAPASANAAQAIAPDSEEGLHAMSRIADVIFSGQVIAIRRHEAVNGATGVVDIEFSVSETIRGVGVGTYTVREWGGLWADGYEPFRVGERYLMLLHAPGSAGLSSPVGGSDGAIPIHGDGGVQVGGLNALAAGAWVDLRWVATGAAHALSYSAEPVGQPTSQPFAFRAYTVDAGAVHVNGPGPTEGRAPETESAPYTAVLGKLRSWEKSVHAAR